MSTPRRPTYATVQMLRGFAASAVVLFHLLPFEQKYLTGATIMPDALVVGQAGVDIFFVISGFIVTTVSIDHAGRPLNSLDFLMRRFWRIYPTYWVYYAVLVAVYLAAPGLINHSATRPPRCSIPSRYGLATRHRCCSSPGHCRSSCTSTWCSLACCA